MYSVFSNSSINRLFYAILDASLDWPRGVSRRDGNLTIDSPGPVCVHLTNPKNKVLTVPRRLSSFPATCAETLWVLAGRNDLEFLEYFLPRAKDFSDDGKTWRAAYGPRLRGGLMLWPDQLQFVADELRSDPTSRRAVITLLDPLRDSTTPIKTKDFPCTQSLSFMVRNGKLDLTVFMRSNDFVWGWSGVNVFEFCTLQEIVSICTDIPLGEFYIISNSLHIYETMGNRIQEMRSKERFDVYDYVEAHDYDGRAFVGLIDFIVGNAVDGLIKDRKEDFAPKQGKTVVTDLARVAHIYTLAKRGSPIELQDVYSIKDSAFVVATLEWLVRRYGCKNYDIFLEALHKEVKRYILGE